MPITERVNAGQRPQQLLEHSRPAFSDIELWRDGYINITHSHLADLQFNIEDFINETRLTVNS